MGISDIFREGRSHWPGGLSNEQYSVLNLIAHCRTGVLGHLRKRCDRCGRTGTVPQSCGNRHCPTCLGPRQAQWSQRICARLPPGGHFHVVFTLPAELRGLCRANRRLLLGLLFAAASGTLKTFMRNNWKAEGGFLAVLHTWGQTLNWHPHLHVLVSAGGVGLATGAWKARRDTYLFPVVNLGKVFRAVFLRLLGELERSGSLDWPADLPAGPRREAWRRGLATRAWCVHSKPTLKATRAAVRYLARYTSRSAIADRRILAADPAEGTIRFSYLDNRDAKRRKEMDMPLAKFIRRFAGHILPKGFQRIRYYGFLNPASAASGQVPAPRAPAAAESAPLSQPCPHCGSFRLSYARAGGSIPTDADAPHKPIRLPTRSRPGTWSVSLLTTRAPPTTVQQAVGATPKISNPDFGTASGVAQL